MQQIDRDQFLQELQLRKHIRSAIKIVRERRNKREQKQLLENEQRLRIILRELISEVAVADEVPHPNTGINKLKPLLKAILTQIKAGYSDLTSNVAQRISFRSHILNAIEKSLAPEKVTDQAAIEEGIELSMQDEDKFISTPHAEEEEEKLSPEETEKKEFTMSGHDLTGRNEAYDTYKSIEKQIVSVYDNLEDPGDREPFYDYLLTNLKMYFDKFEAQVGKEKAEEPVTPEYEEIAAEEPEDPAPAEGMPDLGGEGSMGGY